VLEDSEKTGSGYLKNRAIDILAMRQQMGIFSSDDNETTDE
jgi:hypothetical protein